MLEVFFGDYFILSFGKPRRYAEVSNRIFWRSCAPIFCVLFSITNIKLSEYHTPPSIPYTYVSCGLVTVYFVFSTLCVSMSMSHAAKTRMWEKAACFLLGRKCWLPALYTRACVIQPKSSLPTSISRFPDFDIPIQQATLPFVLASSMAVLADS